MTVLQQGVSIAKETAYGTAATGTYRGYEARDDGFTRDVDFVLGGGRRAGRVGELATRRRKVDLGASGPIETAILTTGHGLILSDLLGKATKATTVSPQGGNPGVYTHTFSADAEGPSESYTIHVKRADTGGTVRGFNYLGAIPTSFTVSVEQRGELMLTVEYDCQSEATVSSSPTATYQSGADVFIFEDCIVKIGGTQIESFNSFEVAVDLMMDTERYFLKGDSEKEKPLRSGIPEVTGSLSGEFRDLTEFNRFVAGGVQTIELEATHPTAITGTNKPQFKLKLYAAMYDGSTPESALDGLTAIEIPFTGLAEEAGNLMDIIYICSDANV